MPVFGLDERILFPHPRLAEENGLLAIGGDLSVERLLAAYRAGIFPWFSESEPLLWWSPDPRAVLFPERLKISKSMARLRRQGRFRISFDLAFEDVVGHCAAVTRPGQKETWITDEMASAYGDLHRDGYAHSVEVWRDQMLVGGLYGVALGRCFFGESMFARESNASKLALVQLVSLLTTREYELIDCQVLNPHMASLGAEDCPREDFLARLARALKSPTDRGPWCEYGDTLNRRKDWM